jgi:hypothetical protein
MRACAHACGAEGRETGVSTGGARFIYPHRYDTLRVGVSAPSRRKARARNELVHPKRGCVDECVWGGCEEHAEHARDGHREMSEMTATG